MRGTGPIKPRSNWHRMLTMLALNGGMLYPAQIYAPRGSTPNNHAYIKTGGLPKMSQVAAFAPLSYAYEHRAENMGLVTIRRHKNRKWVVLLPKGKDVLKMLDDGQTWVFDQVADNVAKYGTNIRT